MRPSLTFAAVVTGLLVLACSDQQATSPGAASRDASAVGQSQTPQANGKPAPGPVAFTKIDLFSTDWISLAAGQGGGGNVQCPAGSVATGGGYEVGTVSGTYPLVDHSYRQETIPITGWILSVKNNQPGAGPIQFKIFVYCAS